MKNESVLLIGGTGFIGSNIAHTLLKNGYEVHIISRKQKSNWRNITIQDQLNVHHLDIQNFENLVTLIKRIKPDGIINAARQGGYSSNEDILETYMVNVSGMLNLLKASVNNVLWMIQISSSFEYGDKSGAVKEIDSTNPVDDYGISKLYATNIFSKVCNFHKIPGVALRVFQAFGPYEARGRLLPYIMSSTVLNHDIILRNPEVYRDFVYIDDVNDAILKSIENMDHMAGTEIVNIGTGIATSVREIAKQTLRITNSRVKVSVSEEKDVRKGASMRSIVANITKAKEILGWNPETNLSLNLMKYYSWMKENINQYVEPGDKR